MGDLWGSERQLEQIETVGESRGNLDIERMQNNLCCRRERRRIQDDD